jgi:hypothetical protein
LRLQDHFFWKVGGRLSFEIAARKTAGVLVVDAQGHGVISAKIASTVHDTFHAFVLSELDRHGKTTPELFEKINLGWHN